MTDEKTAAPEEKAVAPAAQTAQKPANARDAQGGKGRGPRRRNDRKPREPKEFEESILDIARVTRVTKGGRQMRFRVTVIIGDKKGRVGYGSGTSVEVMGGVQKAITKAKQNLINVSIFEDTIPHAVTATFKSSKVMLLPAQDGKGVIAGGAVRKILELAGVKNVLSKSHGSRTKINVTRATFNALMSLQNKAPKGAQKEEAPEREEKVEETPKKAPAKKAAPKSAKPAAKKPAAPKSEK